MRRIIVLVVPSLLVILAVGDVAQVAAYTGADPVSASGIASCVYSEIHARIAPDNSVSYKVYGSCGGAAVSGELTYRDGKFNERFIVYQARISTVGYCDTNPWTTAVNCHDQKVESTGLRFDPGLMASAPLSLIGGRNKEFREAFLSASRPNPPGIPVNFSATSEFGQVVARWLAPDTSGDRPIREFLLQARPQGSPGGGWLDLGRVAWHAELDYRLAANLPERSAAISAWDVRLCAATALAATCTPTVAPTSTLARDRFDAPASSQAVPSTQTPVKAAGRVKSAPSGPPIPICDAAASARDRNSPAAPGLAAQCRALGGQVPDRAAAATSLPGDAPNLNELAVQGAGVAEGDPLSSALRNRQPEGPLRRGFEIGMAAAEGQTLWGPGKQRTLDALPVSEQEGFKIAISFSLDRNRNLELAAIGAAIAGADPVVARARTAQGDERYSLGFDIASGIFGDRALGARGNTQTGPGSLAIRDTLSAPAQRGFNDSAKLHLSRRY